MGLQKNISLYLRCGVQQHIIHRDLPRPQMLRTNKDPHLGKGIFHIVNDRFTVGVDHHLSDRGNIEKCLDNVVKQWSTGQWSTGQWSVVLPLDALTVVAHWDDGNDARHFHPLFVSETQISES